MHATEATVGSFTFGHLQQCKSAKKHKNYQNRFKEFPNTKLRIKKFAEVAEFRQISSHWVDSCIVEDIRNFLIFAAT